MLWKASMERDTQEVLVPSLLQQWKIQVENVPTQFQTFQEYFKEEWLTRGQSWLRKDPKVITRSFMAPKSGPADTGRACRASSGGGGRAVGPSVVPSAHSSTLITLLALLGDSPVGIQGAQAAPANTP